jgi:hypothetical protein
MWVAITDAAGRPASQFPGRSIEVEANPNKGRRGSLRGWHPRARARRTPRPARMYVRPPGLGGVSLSGMGGTPSMCVGCRQQRPASLISSTGANAPWHHSHTTGGVGHWHYRL